MITSTFSLILSYGCRLPQRVTSTDTFYWKMLSSSTTICLECQNSKSKNPMKDFREFTSWRVCLWARDRSFRLHNGRPDLSAELFDAEGRRDPNS